MAIGLYTALLIVFDATVALLWFLQLQRRLSIRRCRNERDVAAVEVTSVTYFVIRIRDTILQGRVIQCCTPGMASKHQICRHSALGALMMLTDYDTSSKQCRERKHAEALPPNVARYIDNSCLIRKMIRHDGLSC
jgi:hypothetical protein